MLYRLYYNGPLRIKPCPKNFPPRSHFMKTMQVQVFLFYFSLRGNDIWQRLVHNTRAFRNLHLLKVHCL